MIVMLPARMAAAAPPVWTNWSTETLRKTVAAGKPTLVLVSDSTCDRCREIEKETNLAAFTQVRLDRDLYPVVARAYAPFAGAVAGASDLPLLLVLTPQLEPVAASSNPDDEHLRAFLSRAEERWQLERDAMIADGGLTVRRLQLGDARPADPAVEVRSPFERLRALPVVERGAALVEMQQTGVYDQLGGGFHRRARDGEWRVPQFEKLLEEQAAIASMALDAWKASGDRNLESLLRATLDCIVRDFTDPQSRAFANAIESHSLVARKGAEFLDGGAYVWRHSEVAKILGRDAAAFEARFGILPEGNVSRELDPHGDLEGMNTLFIAEDRAETRRRFSLTDAELDQMVARSRDKLLAVRLKRPQPAFDRRVITSTNALAISVLARAGAALGAGEYVTSASQTLRTLVSRNVDAKSHAVARYRGDGTIEGTLDDYASLVSALLDVYAATFEPAHLELALALQQKTDEIFFRGGHYVADAGVPYAVQGLGSLDGSVPMRIGRNLLQFGSISGSEPWRMRGSTLLGVDPDSVPAAQVVVVLGSLGTPETQALIAAARKRREPLLVLTSRSAKQRLSAIVPSLRKLEFRPQPTATICTLTGCRTEATTADELRALPEAPSEK